MVIRRIGIDFGTSTSVMMYKDYENGKPVNKGRPFIVGDDNSNTIPTVILKAVDGDEICEICGAKAEGSSVPGERYVNFKMGLASDGEEYQQALALTEDFFRYLRELFKTQQYDGDAPDVEQTYISYPAKWRTEVIEDMKAAARRAGFKNVIGMDEPTAAVNSVVYQNQEQLCERGLLKAGEDNYVLMIDMGAGTMDLVVCKYRPGGDKPLEIMLSWPESQSGDCFGGREIDDRLVEQSLSYLEKYGKHYEDRIGGLSSDNKRWKEWDLSQILNDKESFPSAPNFIINRLEMDWDSVEEYPIRDRESFEKACGDLLETFPKMIFDCGKALREKKGMDLFESMDLIILTGGNSAWYFVEDYLRGQRTSRYGTLRFKKIIEAPDRVQRMDKPQQTVAFGLALHEEEVRRISRELAAKGAESAAAAPDPVKQNVEVASAAPPAVNAAPAAAPKLDAAKEAEIMAEIAGKAKQLAQQEAKRDKGELYYKKVKDLKIIVDLLNESAVALDDKTRVITQSPTANALYIAGRGAGVVGAGLSLAAAYSLGVPTLVAFFSDALICLGGTALAGTFALAAAPLAVLGAGGALIASKAKKNHLIKEKRRLLTEVEIKLMLLVNASEQEENPSEGRKALLETLKEGLKKAYTELHHDLAKA